MAAKKKHRKSKFRAQQLKPVAPATTAPVAPALVTAPVPLSSEVSHLGLIKHDVRRVVVLASAFAVLELVLWYVFGHTGIGNAVYNLIKL